MAEPERDTEKNPVLHVLVVGFHHKRGCQVEYAYPPLGGEGNSCELPEAWKHLPSLALPDGSHNFESDTIYFHLPALGNRCETVFGVACYRQINAEKLLSRSSDITRGTVQKSVCILSALPLYGMIQAKLELVTHAYFDERDFSRVALLEETYRNLNMLLHRDMLDTPQVFLGLPVRDMIMKFRHKILILFKLILLEKKVLFYKTPVKELCTSLLTLCSLFPGMIEKGLREAVANSKYASPELKITSSVDTGSELTADVDSSFLNTNCHGNGDASSVDSVFSNHIKDERQPTDSDSAKSGLQLSGLRGDVLDTLPRSMHLSSPSSGANSRTSSVDSSVTVICVDQSNPDGEGKDDASTEKSNIPKDGEEGKRCTEMDGSLSNSNSSSMDIELSKYGLPLQIFTKGSLCHPYLSLPFLDLLGHVSVRSFLAGATNVLFTQKKHLFDAIVEVDEAKLDIFDNDLRRQLSLTTEDLRFADHLMQHVIGDTSDVFLDGTGWEGGDEWLREQFKLYLLHLLRTSEIEDENKLEDSFNVDFMNAWKVTHNYRMWKATSHPGIAEISPGHPFQGQLSMADVKLKLSVSVLNTERGKKLNQAVNNTGRVVGGALTSAKSYVSTWWSHLSAPPPAPPTTETSGGTDIHATENVVK